MNYTKPEVVSLGEASRVIEGKGKVGGAFDGLNNPRITPAYDLDE
jgi:hypothetical protein